MNQIRLESRMRRSTSTPIRTCGRVTHEDVDERSIYPKLNLETTLWNLPVRGDTTEGRKDSMWTYMYEREWPEAGSNDDKCQTGDMCSWRHETFTSKQHWQRFSVRKKSNQKFNGITMCCTYCWEQYCFEETKIGWWGGTDFREKVTVNENTTQWIWHGKKIETHTKNRRRTDGKTDDKSHS